MRKLFLAAVLAAMALAPGAANAHEPVTAEVCADNVAEGTTHDCVQVATDTEFEDGIYITTDGDASDPRGDGITDGYITVHVGRTGTATVYCEDEGGFNHPASDAGDANGTNDACEPV